MKLISVEKHTATVILWTGYFGLFAIVLLWVIWLSPSKQHPLPLAIAIGLLPLVLPLRGVIKGRHRLHILVVSGESDLFFSWNRGAGF